MRQGLRYIVLSVMMISISGCSSFGRKLKAFLGGKSTPEMAAPARATGVKYSDDSNIHAPVHRQYRRVTKRSLEDESALQAQAGSLWVMEGQGAYLFSQNIVRLIGDPLAVTLEGEPREQIQNKVDVIRSLMAKFEERQKLRQLAAIQAAQASKKKSEKASEGDGSGENKANEAAGKAANSGENLPVKTVPTRVVERTVDGNYRVKGSQPFMLGSREYKVIVTGIVRAEDFNDAGVPATKLMDAKFDVVSARRRETEE